MICLLELVEINHFGSALTTYIYTTNKIVCIYVYLNGNEIILKLTLRIFFINFVINLRYRIFCSVLFLVYDIPSVRVEHQSLRQFYKV